MAPRRAVVIGARRVIHDPKSSPAQVLKALEIYRAEKQGESKPSETAEEGLRRVMDLAAAK